MEMKVPQKSSQNLWVFLLALLQLGHINTAMDLNAATGPLSRSAYTVVQGNKQLVGHVVKRFSAPSLIACSQSCLKNEWCTSTNFKNGEKFCELNMHEIAPGNIVHELTDQPGVTFSMYQKGCQITGCLNGGHCLLDMELKSFSCSCKLPWGGSRCDIKTSQSTTSYSWTISSSAHVFGSSSASASQSTCTSRNVPQYIPSSLSEVSPNSFGNELQSNSSSDNAPQYLTSSISIFHTVSSRLSVSFSTNAPEPSLSSPNVPTHILSSTTMAQSGFSSAKVSWYNSPSDHVIRYIPSPVSVSLKISNPLTNSLVQSRSSSANAYMHSHTSFSASIFPSKSFSGNVAQWISSSSSTFQSTPSSVHLTPHIAASVKVSLSSSTWVIVPQYISSSTSMFRSVSSSANEAGHISSVAIFHSSSSLVTGGSQSVSAANYTHYVFTTLGAEGETGPTSTSGYSGTLLENQVSLSNGIQLWSVPVTGSYVIEATGASGANGTYYSYSQPLVWRLGGLGAKITGTFQLSQGVYLKILVGQEGAVSSFSYGNMPGGGGGASFVSFMNNSPLIVAGGGGGGGTIMDGDPGQAIGNGSECGGSQGDGGSVCDTDTSTIYPSYFGGGGAGFYGNGGGSGAQSPPYSFTHGGTGGTSSTANGGFGGGAFAKFDNGGGGGGYSGGGVTISVNGSTAGGGGSYNGGTNQQNAAGVNQGDGGVIISLIA